MVKQSFLYIGIVLGLLTLTVLTMLTVDVETVQTISFSPEPDIQTDGMRVFADMGTSFVVPSDWHHQPLDMFDEQVMNSMSEFLETEYFTVTTYASPGSLENITPTSISLEVIRPSDARGKILDLLSLIGFDIRVHSTSTDMISGVQSTTTEYVLVSQIIEMPATKIAETRVSWNDTLFVLSYFAESDDYEKYHHHFQTASDSFVLPYTAGVSVDGALVAVDGDAMLETAFTINNIRTSFTKPVLLEYAVFVDENLVGTGQVNTNLPNIIYGGASVSVNDKIDINGGNQYWEGVKSKSGSLVIAGELHVVADSAHEDIIVIPFRQALAVSDE